jgi:hypothetical protein
VAAGSLSTQVRLLRPLFFGAGVGACEATRRPTRYGNAAGRGRIKGSFGASEQSWLPSLAALQHCGQLWWWFYCWTAPLSRRILHAAGRLSNVGRPLGLPIIDQQASPELCSSFRCHQRPPTTSCSKAVLQVPSPRTSKALLIQGVGEVLNLVVGVSGQQECHSKFKVRLYSR